ncbi:MAG: putative Na+/H+ antiporter, partial [Candidatus Accumulibacter sp.]|nr:putative Na+/H+ antiporter [Accumulibacter sp.]
MSYTALHWVSAALFFLAVMHTFSAPYFEKLAHRFPAHGGVFHLLGEVEAVFGVWAMILILTMCGMTSVKEAVDYLENRNFTEPMFVFVIMVVAASKPILYFCQGIVRFLAKRLPLQPGVAFYVVSLFLVPLLGSFITEPAAMTLAAFMLRDMFFSREISTRLKYATIGVLFVNVSVGGVLTPFAAPPVLMVAGKWGWDIAFMITHFGWRALLAVGVNAMVVTWLFRKELSQVRAEEFSDESRDGGVPGLVTVIHLAFLTGVIVFAHHPVVFMGLFLFFLGFTQAYKRYQDRLILREGLMVAFFLAGLVVLGGQQQWWLQGLLMDM